MTDAEDESGFVAVIALAGRFPGADDVHQFWENLCRGSESVTVLTDQMDDSQPGYVPSYGVLNAADEFDADFFGYSPDEALLIDPQQRLLLECAHEALERAGHGGPRIPVTGVFVGGSSNEYGAHLRAQLDHLPLADDAQIRQGNDPDFLSSRIAYKLGLTGPALTVQTACSSSLVAVHLAIQSLLAGDCDLALAGGASVLAHLPKLRYSAGGIFSLDGHCRTFDAAAGGTVGASAVGLVVLRPLADALADGDQVRAVIRGTAVNNDGRDKIGFTAPSVSGQAGAARAAHLIAGLNAEEIGYLEAHGTATSLGDPIEVAALTQAFRESTARRGFCRIGSVKSNIGHADAAAGVVGLIKTVLSVEHGILPASLHFTEPNPAIDFASSPFEVNAETRPWPDDGRPRIGAVNAIGMGGTNAHVIVAQAPAPPASASAGRPEQLLVLSARTGGGLERVAGQLAEHLAAGSGANLADVAWTLQTGRTPHDRRRFVVAADAAEAVAGLRSGRAESTPGDRRQLIFLFADADRVVPGAELYAGQRIFRQSVDAVAELALPHLGADLRATLGTAEPGADGTDPMRPDAMAQVAVFAHQYAMSELLTSWGLGADAVVGSGIGAYAAGCAAQVFSLRDAVRLVVTRSRPDDFARVLPQVTLAPPDRPISTNPAAGWAKVADVSSVEHWDRQRHPTPPIDPARLTFLASKPSVFVDLGPGPGPAAPTGSGPAGPGPVRTMPGPGEAASALRTVLTAVGRHVAGGAAVDFAALHSEQRRRVELPTYPFERRRYHVPAPAVTPSAGPPTTWISEPA